MTEICNDPEAIQEGDLLAYIDGDASSAVAQHIAGCPACTHKAKELALSQALLSGSLYRHSCPEPDSLVDYFDGTLAGSQRLLVVQHVRTCPHCAAELATLARSERQSLRERLGDALRVLEAKLVVLPGRPEPAAVRGLPPGERPAPRVFREKKEGDIEVIVTLEHAPHQPHARNLSGMILEEGRVQEPSSLIRVELYHGDGLVALTTDLERGQFALQGIESAEYDLALVWPEHVLWLRRVQVA